MSETARALTRDEWAALYLDAKGDLVPAANNGSLPGRRVQFTDIAELLKAFPATQDVLGDPLSEFLTMTGGSFSQRLQLPDDANESIAKLLTVEFTGFLPENWMVEVGQNAPDFGQEGGAYYSVILGANGAKMCLFEAIDAGVLRVVS